MGATEQLLLGETYS